MVYLVSRRSDGRFLKFIYARAYSVANHFVVLTVDAEAAANDVWLISSAKARGSASSVRPDRRTAMRSPHLRSREIIWRWICGSGYPPRRCHRRDRARRNHEPIRSTMSAE